MSDTAKKFYLTTPIYYVNARPHIGHAYTTIAADVIARRQRTLLGQDNVWFLTGTDEHGQKVQRSAEAAGITPQQFTDEVSAQFEGLWKRMGITNNDYIRTTDPRHQRGVQKLFNEIYQRGHIYLDTYTGQYSVGEEMFVEGPPGTIGPDGKPTETVTEENFYFRLSAFQGHLIDLIESGEFSIEPEARRNEVLAFLRGNINELVTKVYDQRTSEDPAKQIGPVALGPDASAISQVVAEGKVKISAAGTPYVPGALKDLSISRSSFDWGIPVPEPAASEATKKHVIYVWLDALANYMTAVGYGSDDPAQPAHYRKFWPADIHLVGKEIIRFHCVYWPAFLLGLKSRWEPDASGDPKKGKLILDPDAAKLLPKKVQAHGWLLFEESKMSKSRGNIVRTETILDAFGTLKPKPIDWPGAPLSDEYWKHEQDLFASDVLRYFLLREIPFGQDGSFSFDALVQRYNSDLANGYGNLVSRTLAMIRQYFSAGEVVGRPSGDSVVPPLENGETSFSLNETIREFVEAVLERTRETSEQCDFSKMLESVWSLVAVTDSFISEKAPWKLAKLDTVEASTTLRQVLYTAAESIRVITALLYPVLPYSSAKIWEQLGLGDIEAAAKSGELENLTWGGLKPGTKLGPLGPIFPRADKGLIQLMTDMEQNNATNNTQNSTQTNTITEAAAATAVESTPLAVAPEPATEANTEATPQIAIDDFAKVDLRVARILVAERIPKADKLLRLEVDLGYERRQILSGIAEWYTPEELIGRRIILIANLAPRKMRGLESHGMLLAASNGEDGKPILATFAEDDQIELGSRLR